MLPALIVIISSIAVLGIFLAIRSIFRLFLIQQHKLAVVSLSTFLLIPALCVLGFLLSAMAADKIWIYLPLVLLLLLWLSLGYLLEIYLRWEQRRKLSGEPRFTPARPKHYLIINLGLIALGIGLWLFGALIGFGNWHIIETAVMAAALFLFIRSTVILWKYRGF